MNEKPSISKIAWGQYKKNISSYLALAFVFLLVGAALIALEIALSFTSLSGTLFITIPFIVLPFVFAIQFAMTHIRTGEYLSSKLIGGGWSRYMSPASPYYGTYRVMISFLKAFVAYFAPYMMASLLYAVIAANVDPSFNEALNKIYDMFKDETVSMSSIYEYINNTPCVINMYITSLGVGMGVGSYVFIRSIFINSSATYVRGMMLGGKAHPRVSNAIFQYGFRKIKKSYYKEYYKALWFFIPLLVLGFAGGYILACLIPVSLPLSSAPCFGFAGELILIAFFMPYAFEVQQELTFRYAKEYSKASVELARMNLDSLRAQQQMSEEQSRIIDEQIKEAEAKMKEEEENKNDSDSSDSQN